MFRPESIYDLRTFPAVIFAIFRRQRNRINISSKICPDINPFAFMSTRTCGRVEWLNLRFYLFFNFSKERFHLLGIAARQLIFADKPCHRIQVNTGHLHTQTCSLNESCSATHKWLQDFQIGKFTGFLMIAVIVIPYNFCSLRWIIWTFCCSCNQQ